MPACPLNRVASNHLAGEVPGWGPPVNFVYGLHRTMNLYFTTMDPNQVRGFSVCSPSSVNREPANGHLLTRPAVHYHGNG